VLTMPVRSGPFFCFLAKNLSNAIPTPGSGTTPYETSGVPDPPGHASGRSIPAAALPVTGRLLRPDPTHSGNEPLYSSEEERSLALEGIAHLPDAKAICGSRLRCPEAIRITNSQGRSAARRRVSSIVEGLPMSRNLGWRLSRAETTERILERTVSGGRGQWQW